MGLSNRRDFLKKAAIGGVSVGTGLAATGLSSRRIVAQGSPGFHRTVYRQLG